MSADTPIGTVPDDADAQATGGAALTATAEPAADAAAAAKEAAAKEAADRQANLAVRVTADRVLCKNSRDGEKRSRAGILIPATAVSTDRAGIWAEVTDVGPLVRTVEKGNSVLFLPESAIDVDIHGETYVIVRERDVHAIASPVDEPSSTGLYL